ncbi:MAG TPA: peptidase [Bdellovibrionales bacterium]|nr:peptidase [Pseudobdellovibrionaceae bacterium]HAG91271.1 peptidase [Bdellovibrionales bacterium]
MKDVVENLRMEILNQDQWLEKLKSKNSTRTEKSKYKAMYSTWWDGIVTEPHMMMIPVDDHQVHRGDAVFEAMKWIHGKAYLQKEHLDRLERSQKSLYLENPLPRKQLEEILKQTVTASKLESALLRLFVGRGPGSFTTNPYDTLGSQFHLVVTDLTPPSKEKREKGVSLMVSKIPVKEPFWSKIKSCNYLSNVMMKKEALDEGYDFSVGVTPEGKLTEGSTESLILIDQDGFLRRPEPDQILAGTTMLRIFELSETLISEGKLAGTKVRNFTLKDLKSAKEVLMVGTTIDVLSVTSLEGSSLGGGTPGPVSEELNDLLIQDQKK